MRRFMAVLLLGSNILFAQMPADTINPPDYLNSNLPVSVRVDDLIARMTLEEKVSQMVNNASAIPRLQIPEYNWWNECLHGVALSGIATVFPQAIALAATWNTDLMFEIADVISTEARAKYHDYISKDERDIHKGLTFWSPNINIFRDPRWGRGQETYGEDPYLTARFGVEFVRGLQGNDPKYFKVISTPKHYAVHSGPEPDRHTFNAIVENRDLYDTYLPAFEACVKEAGAFSVMCAYNRLYGEACCGSPLLLSKILREDWGFKGYVVSDCGAILDIYQNHKIVATAPEAAALAVKAGTDLNCGQVYSSAIIEAVQNGLLSEQEIDTAVARLFTARFKLGQFDPPELVPYSDIPIEENDSEEHRQLSIRAAQESIVLLKNSKRILPLKKDLKRIAVIGPTADSYQMLLGNYNGTPSRYVTPLQGIRNKVFEPTAVIYEPGCNLVEPGNFVHNLSANVLSTEGQPGLKVEYFASQDPSGQPFFSRVDKIHGLNWSYGTTIPSFKGRENIASICWSGMFKAPTSGRYKFTIKSDSRVRLIIDNKIIIEDWKERKFASLSNSIKLKEGEMYPLVLEFSRCGNRPQLFVEWELLNHNSFKNALDLAQKSDVVIFVGGLTAQLEGEEMAVSYDGFYKGDRLSLDLPKVQEKLLKELHATGKPIVLVLTSGSALSVNWAQENLPAIIQLWYPGQEGGTALADVLFGDYNPAGRLPITFYKSVEQLPPFEDYNMRGRTYRYFEGEPLFPFGYGLSYTNFAYSNLIIDEEIKAGEIIKVAVDVSNRGKIAGDEVVQLYVKNLDTTVPTPIHSLQGFKRINLKPGETRRVEFLLQPRQLAVIKDQDMLNSENESSRKVQYIVEPGAYEISVGGMQPVTISETTQIISKKIKIIGESYLIK